VASPAPRGGVRRGAVEGVHDDRASEFITADPPEGGDPVRRRAERRRQSGRLDGRRGQRDRRRHPRSRQLRPVAGAARPDGARRRDRRHVGGRDQRRGARAEPGERPRRRVAVARPVGRAGADGQPAPAAVPRIACLAAAWRRLLPAEAVRRDAAAHPAVAVDAARRAAGGPDHHHHAAQRGPDGVGRLARAATAATRPRGPVPVRPRRRGPGRLQPGRRSGPGRAARDRGPLLGRIPGGVRALLRTGLRHPRPNERPPERPADRLGERSSARADDRTGERWLASVAGLRFRRRRGEPAAQTRSRPVRLLARRGPGRRGTRRPVQVCRRRRGAGEHPDPAGCLPAAWSTG
jgi:hypothetical protein